MLTEAVFAVALTFRVKLLGRLLHCVDTYLNAPDQQTTT